jgi:hypothetical protein
VKEKTTVSPFQEGRMNSARSSSGARTFATSFVSKSVPAPKPRYSCVGRLKQ